MKRHSIHTPIGTKDYLFEECRAMRRVQSELSALFERRGFSEVICPSFEYYDVVLAQENPLPEQMLFKMSECTGRLMVLRPDMTTPIARIAATKMPENSFPARLYYMQKIYRAGTPGSGHSTEFMQGGIELLGYGGLNADIEMIVMAVDALRACTDRKIHIEIGDAGFFKNLAGELHMDDGEFERMRSLIENKNFAGLNDMLEEYGDVSAKGALSRLSRLFGGEEVLDQAEEYAKNSNATKDLEYLRSLYGGLREAGVADCVSIDLGLVHQIDYYTGVIIRGYLEGAGKPVLSGGRYDKLIGTFGREMPAIGFAMDIDAVAALTQVEPVSAAILIHVLPGAIRAAFNYMDCTPGCQISPERSLERTLVRGAREGKKVVVIDRTGKVEART